MVKKKKHFKVQGKFGVYTACNRDISQKKIQTTENKDEVTCERCIDIIKCRPDWL